jgi:hypothetical protein
VRVADDRVRILVKARGDAEVDVWSAQRKVELFEKVFRRKVEFAARNTNRPRRRKRPPGKQVNGRS